MLRSLKNKKGAASFYIVAFSTLVLVIIAASFAAVVISEIARTSNDDLSQSAYDSAMAGVEDAKLAYSNYITCLKKGVVAMEPDGMAPLTCEEIVWLVQNPNNELSGCDMVAKIVGRICEDCSGEVMISESSSVNNNMNQAYTCAKIETVMPDYRATVNSANRYKVIKVELEDESLVSDINWVKLSWYAKSEGNVLSYTNTVGNSSGSYRVAFQPISAVKVAAPPTVSLSLIQTAGAFTMEEINGQTVDGQTDRATIYLVPSNNKDLAAAKSNTTYVGAYDSVGGNEVSASEFAATNNLEKNLPYAVYCPDSGSDEYTEDEFVCSVKVGIPGAIGGRRSAETFLFIVALPYGQPDTEFAMEFCTTEEGCYAQSSQIVVNNAGGMAYIENMQVAIDSTGRANDLVRRVELRLESSGAEFAYPLYAIEALDGPDGAAAIEKKLTVTSEWQR